jgi:hypothetical protein
MILPTNWYQYKAVARASRRTDWNPVVKVLGVRVDRLGRVLFIWQSVVEEIEAMQGSLYAANNDALELQRGLYGLSRLV